MNQYNWKNRIYHNGKKFNGDFSQVTPKKVIVKLHPSLWSPYNTVRTPFAEVKLYPFQIQPDLREFLVNLQPRKLPLENIWDEFKQAIFENWMPDKIHLIGASSGYDSRLIAKAVQELHKANPGWMGETYFVECAGEPEGFIEIMRILGFTNTIIWIPDFTFEYFENLHERFNGLCAYPMNQWYDFYQQWNQEDIQYISGYGGNVADIINPNSPYQEAAVRGLDVKRRLKYYFNKQYYYQLSAFRQPKYSFHPFWSWRYIKAVSGINHKYTRNAELMADLFVNECRNVKRQRILYDVTKNGHRTIKQNVINKLQDWYKNTTYGKRNPCGTTNKIEYHKFWLQLCIANYAKANNISIN